MWFMTSVLTVLLSTLQTVSPKVSPKVVNQTVLWRSGKEGEVHLYRTPLLTYTPQGNLVAFNGARKYASADMGPKFIAVRRSTDKGLSWSPTAFVVDDGDRHVGLNVGSVIVDNTTATIFVMFVYCENCAHRSLLLINSTDDGQTWGEPRNITSLVGADMVTHPSPGFGIQKKVGPAKGRLVVCGHGMPGGAGSLLLLSDDHGVTWRGGAFVSAIPFKGTRDSEFHPDECQPVELPDGTIHVILRNHGRYRCHCKMVMRSYDGGETLSYRTMYFDGTLIEPRIASGLWYGGGVMYYTGPDSKTHREKMTLRWSYSNGTSWDGSLRVWERDEGYSTMTMLPQDSTHLYILYERGEKSSTQEIALAIVQL
ncbi:sialidase-1-like [Branchiostoma lanceolatum]|uniref:sialidase-1-like n=1 Tax=Branchiostoma lanceolatum TaxID=7740 RepID=UPI003451FC8F